MECIKGLQSRESGVAATIDRVRVRYMNLGREPRELKAGTVIGSYQPVKEDQMETTGVTANS